MQYLLQDLIKLPLAERLIIVEGILCASAQANKAVMADDHHQAVFKQCIPFDIKRQLMPGNIYRTDFKPESRK